MFCSGSYLLMSPHARLCFNRFNRPTERPNRSQPVSIADVTSELAARVRELAGQEPKPSLRRIEQRHGRKASIPAMRRCDGTTGPLALTGQLQRRAVLCPSGLTVCARH